MGNCALNSRSTLDSQVREVAGLLLTAHAQVVEENAAIATCASNYEALAATITPKLPLGMMLVNPVTGTAATLGANHALDAIEQLFGHDGRMAALVFGPVAGFHVSTVVAVGENLADRAD
ncbi:hypothetical protein ACFQV2_05970 [Actinokineospora soli]|uniref:Uncharacterized protein n=1 Tax=Actinokineospora soli TaxID=1048753 RepID=A0ABW2TK97_9PSEU